MDIKFSLDKQQLELTLPLYLAGYAARTTPATEIHDPLYINCFYIEDGIKSLAMLSVDLLGVYKGQYERIIEAIHKSVNIENLDITLSCVHTHAAPAFNFDEAHSLNMDKLFDEVVKRATLCIQNCIKNAKSNQIGYAEKVVRGVGANRRTKDVEVNTVLRVLQFDQNLIVNFNCHPTHLSADNLLISKDYQGACMDKLIEHGYKPMFFQGACGDVSTRFTRIAQTFDDLKRLGDNLADEVLELTKEMSFTAIDSFNYEEIHFNLDKKQYESKEYYETEIKRYIEKLEESRSTMSASELRILETAVQGMEVEYRCSLNQDQIVTDIRAGILTLGKDIAITFVPFEFFSKLGDRITDHSLFKHTIVVGYTFNGLGYLPDEESFKDSGYEVLSCTYQKGAGEIVADKIVAHLNSKV